MPKSSLPLSRCWPGLLLAILLAGCTSVDKRIAENRTVFAALSPEAQHDIRNGQVSLGFTPAMVYMALGKPAQINTSADAKEVRCIIDLGNDASERVSAKLGFRRIGDSDALGHIVAIYARPRGG